MAKIGYGYGSEWQLLRFLGHHRTCLENAINKVIGNEQDHHFQWIDFEFDKSSSSFTGDSELKGLTFLKKLIDQDSYEVIHDEFKKYGINKYDTWQSWDAVFKCGNTIYLVEAKAHKDEIKGNIDNGGKSKNEIFAFFEKYLTEPFKPTKKEWLGHYYQLANRLATTAFLKKHLNRIGLDVKLLYIYFIYGYEKKKVIKRGNNPKYKVIEAKKSSKDAFLDAISIEKKTLGIDNIMLNDYLVELFMNSHGE